MNGFLLALAATVALQTGRPVDATPYMAAQDRVTLPDGRRMNIYCTGQGDGPTVVLEGGWTTETSYWRQVQPRLAERSRVCSYDRAGYGFSDPGPMPRTAAAIEHDFAQLMDATPVRGRIILVAHSLGSYPARLYAQAHPDRVAALILLDPPTEDDRRLDTAIRKDADPERMLPPALACSAAVIARPDATPTPDICLGSPDPTMPDSFNRMRADMQRSVGYQQSAASEIREMFASSPGEARANRRPLGSMPVIVVTAGDSAIDPAYSAAENAGMRRAQWQAQDEIARLSSRPSHHLLAGASHFIPKEHPEAVVEAVEEARRLMAQPDSAASAGTGVTVGVAASASSPDTRGSAAWTG